MREQERDREGQREGFRGREGNREWDEREMERKRERERGGGGERVRGRRERRERRAEGVGRGGWGKNGLRRIHAFNLWHRQHVYVASLSYHLIAFHTILLAPAAAMPDANPHASHSPMIRNGVLGTASMSRVTMPKRMRVNRMAE